MTVAEFITTQRAQHGIPFATSCRALSISPAWYYKWRHGDASPRRARREQLAIAIKQLFAAHQGKWGSPRITDDLRDAGWRVSKKTVAAIMRELGLVARPRRRRKSTTRQGKGRWRAPDLIRRDFPASKLNQKWYGDGTEIETDESKLYLDSVLDVRSRRVVGFAMDEHHDAELAHAALAMAVAVRGGKDAIAGVIMHTDQGSEGDFNRPSQHLDVEVQRWVWVRGSARFVSIGGRFRRRGGRRLLGGRIVSGSGRRSLAVPARRTRRSRSACRRRWERDGFATLAA